MSEDEQVLCFCSRKLRPFSSLFFLARVLSVLLDKVMMLCIYSLLGFEFYSLMFVSESELIIDDYVLFD